MPLRSSASIKAAHAVGTRRLFDFERAKPVPMIPVSDNGCYADSRSATRIGFITDAAGKVTGAVLNPGRWEQKGVRID